MGYIIFVNNSLQRRAIKSVVKLCYKPSWPLVARIKLIEIVTVFVLNIGRPRDHILNCFPISSKLR